MSISFTKVSDENKTKKHRSPVLSVFITILTDILLAGIALCIFATFHHVIPTVKASMEAKRILENQLLEQELLGYADVSGSDAAEPTMQVLPPETAEPQDVQTEQTEEKNDEDVQETVPAEPEEMTEPEEPAEAEEVWKYEHLMSEEIVITEDSYSSPDIYVKITRVSSEDSLVKSAYTMADIYLRDVHCLQTYSPGGRFVQNAPREPVIDMSKQTNAIVATNGDYYSVQYGSGVVRNGFLVRYPSASMDSCVLYNDGRMVTHRMENLQRTEQIDAAFEDAWQVWSFGPALLNENGEIYSDLNNRLQYFVAGTHPRTGIGYFEPGHYCLVVVDGRQAGIPGTDIIGMAQLFQSFGCTAAYNLDGGGSSCMTFNTELASSPSEVRSLSDIILVCEYEGSVAQRMEENTDE